MKNTTGTVYMVTERGLRTVKIGFTTNIEQRKTFYRTHSTCAMFIDTVEGTQQDEKNFQRMLAEMGFEKVFPHEAKSEWFKIPKGIKKSELVHAGFSIFSK